MTGPRPTITRAAMSMLMLSLTGTCLSQQRAPGAIPIRVSLPATTQDTVIEEEEFEPTTASRSLAAQAMADSGASEVEDFSLYIVKPPKPRVWEEHDLLGMT